MCKILTSRGDDFIVDNLSVSLKPCNGTLLGGQLVSFPLNRESSPCCAKPCGPPPRLALPPPSASMEDGCAAFIILDVFPFPPSSALPAVASWHGLNCARTPNDVLLPEQQRPRRRAAPLRSGHTIGLHGWWWRRSETFWWNHRCR